MNIVFIIIILIIMIYLIYITYKYLIKSNEFFYENNNINNNVSLNVGNELSAYFYDLGKAIINQENFKYKQYNEIFFKNLPIDIKIYELNNIYNCFIQNNITSQFFIENNYKEALWECINKDKENYNKCMKPIINKILNDTFIKSNLVKNMKEIIIHFRCADVPFVKHYAYHFQKYQYFKDALDDIKQTISTNKVIILYNNSHLSNERNMNACNIYVDELKKYIINLGYNVNIESYSNIDDFAMMFYAPAVISTHSSFSFMSGFFGMGKFISAGHFYEKNIIEKCDNCDNWLYKGYDLNHKDVVDYYDTTTVINQLKSNGHLLTLSTCFYLFKNKHNTDNYKAWIRNLLSIVNNFNLVIYTNDESLKVFEEFIDIKNKNILVIIKNIEHFYLYKYKDKWIRNHINNNIGLHKIIDWHVNLLWNEKIFFIKNTIDNKYFNTPLYGWCDIGYFRNNYSDMINYKNWPSNNTLLENIIKSNKMHIGNVNNSSDEYNSFINEIKKHYNLKLSSQPLSNIEQISIAAGFYLLNSYIINKIATIYEEKINYYFNNNYYIKHDQNIYLDMIIMNSDLFQLYYENDPKYDNWFMFQRILS